MKPDADESGATPYRCERCGHVAVFPSVAFSPIGYGRCTDRQACEMRQTNKIPHRKQLSHA